MSIIKGWSFLVDFSFLIIIDVGNDVGNVIRNYVENYVNSVNNYKAIIRFNCELYLDLTINSW